MNEQKPRLDVATVATAINSDADGERHDVPPGAIGGAKLTSAICNVQIALCGVLLSIAPT
jgi:hypothetical protein